MCSLYICESILPGTNSSESQAELQGRTPGFLSVKNNRGHDYKRPQT